MWRTYRRTAVTTLTVAFLFASVYPLQASDESATPTETFSLEALKHRAEQDDPWAQLNLGALYDHGLNNTMSDRSQAAHWYRKAAEQGLALAQFNLGHLYALGEGIDQDFKQALIWLSKAAEQDIVEAQYLLGVLYSQGLGTGRDLAVARLWLGRAIANGDSNAREFLDQLPAPAVDEGGTGP